LFNAPTALHAKGSILSPCTTIKSGLIFLTYFAKPAIVLAKIMSVESIVV
jgi:hypothetical protein